jgi:hypothetical protein
MKPSVRYASLSGYLELALSLGLDPDALMASVGLAPPDLAIPDKWVLAANVARLLELSARTSGTTTSDCGWPSTANRPPSAR